MSFRTKVQLSNGYGRLVIKASNLIFLSVFLFFFCTLSTVAEDTRPYASIISAGNWFNIEPIAISDSDAADQTCARFSVGSIVSPPPELKSHNGTLEVTMRFLMAVDSQGLTRYCYVTDTGLEAPTLRVNPGDKLTIHFENDLPANLASGSDAPPMKTGNPAVGSALSSGCSGDMSPFATNMHFHGMNVAPTCGQDEVVRTLIQPGQAFDYELQIPLNEPPGLYWYHPHPHGLGNTQVLGGATGVLIVEGLQAIDTALASLPERTFVIRDQNVRPSESSGDSDAPSWDLSVNYVPVTYPNYTPGIIQTDPARRELWRVANTAANTVLNLQYIVNGAPQAVQIVAIDGYPIASGNSGQQYERETSVLLPPAARAEFVVTTPNTGDQAQLITQKWNNGPSGPSDPARPIANIVSGVQGSQNSLSTKFVEKLRSLTEPAGGMRFADLAAAPAIATRTLYFSEGLVDPTNPQSPYGFYITEEGQQPAVFSMSQQPNIVVHSGAVEDWVIENRATEDHIFHIHQIHFQVLEVNGQAVNDAAIRDTVDVPYWSGSGPYPKVKLHMDFRDPNIVGTFVYHCHILAHEDNGMMGEIQVLPPGTASMTTAAVSESHVAPNENITLTANVLDATTGKATPGGLVQFLLNGTNLGEPTPLVNGQAQLAAVINGNEGTNELAVFYQGDSQYAESTSPLTPITISKFALSSIGAKAVAGTAAIANVTVNVANNYTAPISLTCTVPASLTNTSCSVSPISITGTGEVSLTVNSGAMHQPSSKLTSRTGIFVGASYTSLSCLLLVGFQRRRWSGSTIIACAILASLVTLLGCGPVSPTGPGTNKGTFNVMVTGTSGSGPSLYQASIDVPITIQ